MLNLATFPFDDAAVVAAPAPAHTIHPADIVRQDLAGNVRAYTRATLDASGLVSARSEFAATRRFGLTIISTRIVALDLAGNEVWACDGPQHRIAGAWDPRGASLAESSFCIRIAEGALQAMHHLAVVHATSDEGAARLAFAAREGARRVRYPASTASA